MTQLSEILHRGVPEAPSLVDLASRAETQARHSRRRRRTAGAAAAATAVVVAAVAGVATVTPRASTDAPPAAESSVRECAADTRDATLFESTDDVAFVRFCPPDGRFPAMVPRVALTDDLAPTAARLNEAMATAEVAFCAYDAAPFAVQVGYLDGTTVTYDERDGCGGAYGVVMRAIAEQESAGLPALDLPALGCSDPPSRGGGPTPADGGVAESALTTLPAASAIICTIDELLPSPTVVPGDRAEQLRLAVLSARYVPGPTECPADSGRGQRVDRVVLRLVDGSVHVLEIDHCEQATLDGDYLGRLGSLLPGRG